MDKECLTDLKEIALKTGFSVSTVSRALKHKGELAPATRAKVLEMAGKLGYHDNRLSNAMRTGKTGVVGVVMGIWSATSRTASRATSTTSCANATTCP